MSMRTLPRLLLAAASLGLLSAPASLLAAAQPWQLQPAPLLRGLQLSEAAVEAWSVQLDGVPADLGEAWTLPLPEGLLQLQTTGLVGSPEGDFRWQGKAADGSDQHALIVRRGGALAGLLSTTAGLYELAPDASGNLLLKLDSSRFPACLGGVEAPSGHDHGHAHHHQHAGLAQADLADATRGSQVQIDVMVLYTPQARDGAGGVAQIEAVAQAAVDAANLAFANAQAAPRFELVSTRLANRNDAANGSADLNWVANDATVAQWRDEAGADLVGLIVENAGGGCGIGYVMRNVGPGFEDAAFQVTQRSCAVGNLTYAHEHGHNMGMEHDPANGTSPANASFPWSFGHFVNGSYRTVMSYSNQCVGGCTRRPYFSNPDISFNGAPTGIANERDNARTADAVAAIVAGFRATADGLFANGFE